MPNEPLILWFRRDLRLDDNPMLQAALETGRPLLPVFILDPETEALGAAPLWRMGLAVGAFAERLAGVGSGLILRRGPALPVLERLIAETGAAGVIWGRQYDGPSQARDTAVKAALKERGLIAQSHAGHLLHEPWAIKTLQGQPFKVFTPFWKALRNLPLPPALAAPKTLPAPTTWPVSDDLASWNLGAPMRRGAAVVLPHQTVGEIKALQRLADFLDDKVSAYPAQRDLLAQNGTSRLSENLTYGEIGPRRIWHAAALRRDQGDAGAESFLRQLAWRDFAWHLFYHSPQMDRQNWRGEWDAFPWAGDSALAESWRQGRTGIPLVDAGLREMFVTGTMHNRARMVVASYLTKHLLTHWKVGLDWFADCLTDWDAANNAMGWQWVAGSGPDAAPYFRIFNPEGQADRFDPDRAYIHRWVAELSREPGAEARAYFDAVPKSWNLSPDQPYPKPVVGLAEGREKALAAYGARNA
ncbi:cryptochrome/photolyase family protein [Neogemmobacter tilapiae]|uniref:Deoxyribodipyrimidine photo-lyase n=1 Tax=Neogemmobacter tilapiae TaxID=875041 RepID=A0A918WPG2_9RHOB|nr:deoxyribodipyrimidine photo-lyase [Gemmobacter tilapiae]GHC62054.1 deoxyribodipyrimidine photo-lyase [Gemmobacter tilapiae]